MIVVLIRSKTLEECKKTLNGMLLGILVYAIVFAVVGLAISNNKVAYFIGLVLGCIISAFMAIHLYRSLDYCLDLDPESAEKTMRKRTLLRFLIMLVAVGLAFCFPNVINPIGLFFGMMGLKISAYFEPFIHR